MHCNRTINITNCPKSVIIHITERILIGKEICVHSSNAVCVGLAKARMVAGYRLPVISVVVVVAVAVCRLQRRRVSAHAVADTKQELESRIRPVVELGQTAIT